MEKFGAKLLFNTLVSKLQNNYLYDEARSIAMIYFEDVLLINKIDIVNNNEISIDINTFDNHLSKLLQYYPIQYLAQKAYFMDSFFIVNQHTLIPRQETEELVLLISNYYENSKNINVLDIGTGSGCIPISLKKRHPSWKLFGLDISKEALEIAHFNSLNLKSDVTFYDFDILDNKKLKSNHLFDCVVSNPPYILEQEKKEMHDNVLKYEPHSALFVKNEEPLIFYKKILEFNKKYLINDGLVFFEINPLKTTEIEHLLNQYHYSDIKIIKDFNNKCRFAVGKKQ